MRNRYKDSLKLAATVALTLALTLTLAPIRDLGVLGRAADYGGGASGSPGIKDDSNRFQVSAAPVPVMAGEALVVRGAPQDPDPVKFSSTQLLALLRVAHIDQAESLQRQELVHFVDGFAVWLDEGC